MSNIIIKVGNEIFEFYMPDKHNKSVTVARLTADGLSHKYCYTVKEIERGRTFLRKPGADFKNELKNNLEAYRTAIIKFNSLKVFA